MASQVTVIATDLRRTTLKVSPGMYLVDVLQDACKKLGIDSNRYLLKSNKKQLDLSLTFRNSGLPPGAKLELVVKSNTPSAVTVGLQLPQPDAFSIPGGRLSDRFPSDLTLWKVLRQFESGKASAGRNLNITARGVAETTTGAVASGSGQLYYEAPVLNIMGRELAGFADFQKTLSQLGYNSGSVLIRLSYRKTDQTLFAAMEEIGRFFQETEEKKAEEPPKERKDEATETAAQSALIEGTASTATVGSESATPAQPATGGSVGASEAPASSDPATGSSQAAPTTTGDAMDVDPASAVPTDPLRPVHVFSAPASSTPAAALVSFSEADFTPTVQHAQLHQARLLQSSQNRRLPSDAELEQKALAEETRVASIAGVDVRVRFPDTTSAQWRFGHDDTAATLYRAVRSVMARPELPFRLHLPGVQTPIRDGDDPGSRLIRGLKMKDRVLVSVAWDDAVPPEARKLPFMKGELAKVAKDVPIPEPPNSPADDKTEGRPVQIGRALEQAGADIAKKVPKWLKLGKK